MNFAHQAIRASLATYLSAMFAVLSFALVKIDFTNYEVGRAGLFIATTLSGIVAYRFICAFMRTLKLPKNTG